MVSPDSFPVVVEGVGTLICKKRTVRVAVAITAEYNRLTEGAEEVSGEFASVCNFLAYLKVVVISGPEGWDPYGVDPDAESEMEVLHKAYRAIKEAEGRFREKPDAKPKGPSAGSEPID
jgi:hypothetical protein